MTSHFLSLCVNCFASSVNAHLLFAGANDARKADPNLFLPFIDNKCLPESVIKFFRFGVPPLTEDYKNGVVKNGKSDPNYFDEKDSFGDDDSFDNKEKLTAYARESVM